MAENYDISVKDVTDNFDALGPATAAAIAAILGSTTDLNAKSWDGTTGFTQGELADTTYLKVEANSGTVTLNDINVPIIDAAGSSADIKGDFSASSDVQALVLGTGSNEISFAEAYQKDVTVVLTGGENDITTAAGDDLIVYAAAELDARSTESLDDGIALQATGKGDNLKLNDGDDTVQINEGSIASTKATIDGGDGFDGLLVNDLSAGSVAARAEAGFEIVSGKLTLDNIQFTDMEAIVFNNGKYDNLIDGQDAVTILNSNVGNTLVTRLYQIVYGRQPIDQIAETPAEALAGIKWWFDNFSDITDSSSAAAGNLVANFLSVQEFRDNYANASATQYVDALFDNLNAVVDGKPLTELTIGNDTFTKADFVQIIENAPTLQDGFVQVAWVMASNETVEDVMGIDGAQYSIDLYNA